MSLHVTQQLMEPHINTRFDVANNQNLEVILTLTKVADLGSTPRQEQFSLTFQGPLEVFMPQGMYRLQHETLGELDLFLVPIERHEAGYMYEAIFNRLVKVE